MVLLLLLPVLLLLLLLPVPVLPVVRRAVADYVERCPYRLGPDEPLFVGSRGGRLPHTANHNNAHAPPAGASAKDAMVAGRRVIGSAAFGTHRSPRQPPWRPPRGRVPISCPAMIWPPS